MYEQGNLSTNYQYSAKATYLFGSHSIKGGVLYEDVDYSQANQRTGPTFAAADGRQTGTGASISILPDVNFGRIFRVTRANFNVQRNTTQRYTAFNPLSPPSPQSATSRLGECRLSRLIVVFVAMIPSIPRRVITSTMISVRSCSSRGTA